MDVEHDVRPRQVEQVGVAGDVARMVGEALAAVVGVLEPGALEHRPPGAVEHEDPLAEKCFESVARVAHVSLPCPKRWEPGLTGSLGVF